jgi:hypothetical protein
MSSDHHTLFIQTLTFLFQAQQSVIDEFFVERFSENITAVLAQHIAYHAAHSDRRAIGRDYIRACKEMAAALEAIGYLNIADSILVATAHERLLVYLRDLVADVKRNLVKNNASVPVSEPTTRPESSPVLSPKTLQSKKVRNPTQEKILEFVKQAPDCRPKDIIGEFSALSQRTVKRSLKELSDAGLIVKKTAEDKAVYYSAASL